MASGATAKYALPYPLGTDAPNIPADVQALASAIDAILAPYAQDLIANRPAVGKTGRTFTQTDVFPGATWRDSGTEWRALGSRVQANAAGDTAQIVRAFSGQTANLQEWQNSAAAVMAYINPNGTFDNRGGGGSLFTSGGLYNNSAEVILTGNSGTTQRSRFTDDGTYYYLQTDHMVLFTRPFSSAYAMAVNADSTVSAVKVQIRGSSGQTGNLTEWQDGTGAILAKIASGGAVVGGFASHGFGKTSAQNYGTAIAGTTLSVDTNQASVNGIAVRGAASQSVDLQQWQSSAGTVLASVAAAGYGMFPSGLFGGSGAVTTGPRNMFTVNGPSETAFGVRGAASQSGNLQEWQNSAGTVLAKIVADGSFLAPSFGSLNGTHAFYSDGSSNPSAVIRPAGAGLIGLAVKAQASQSANLTEWQNSAGSAMAWVNNLGTVIAPNSVWAGASGIGGAGIGAGGALEAIGPVAIAAKATATDIMRGYASSGTQVYTVNQTGQVTAKSFTAPQSGRQGGIDVDGTLWIGTNYQQIPTYGSGLVTGVKASAQFAINDASSGVSTNYIRVQGVPFGTVEPRALVYLPLSATDSSQEAGKFVAYAARGGDTFGNGYFGQIVVGGASWSFTNNGTASGVAWSATSDVRSKQANSIRTPESGHGLEIIRRAPARHFRYKGIQEDREHLFPFADDLPDYMVHLTPGHNDPDDIHRLPHDVHYGMKSVDLRDAIGVLWHGVGEIDDRLTELERTLASR